MTALSSNEADSVTRLLATLIAILAIAASVSASTKPLGPVTRTAGCRVRGALPDPRCTPGSVIVGASRRDICAPGYPAGRHRVTDATKRRVYAAYGLSKRSTSGYELDRLVPLELGGSDDAANLYPEAATPKPGYHEKDQVERQLRRDVCEKHWRLGATQRAIARNWLKFYAGPTPPPPPAPTPTPAPTPAPPPTSTAPPEPTPSPQPTTSKPCDTGAPSPPHYSHVVWIVFENHSSAQFLRPGSYASRLAGQCSQATNYSAVSHPSLPNYIAMTSGSTQGITDDAPPSSHRIAAPSIFSQAPTWRSLQESMPASCLTSDSGGYAVRHNPAAYFTNLSTCGADDVALGSAPDLSAAFTFVTPNLCDDGHDCPQSTADAWLRDFAAKVIATPEYQDGSTAVFITSDEDDSRSGNRVSLIVMAPTVPAGRSTATAFDHYSLLRTTEDILSLPPLGGAGQAADMRIDLGL
jgi:hypothetical protein